MINIIMKIERYHVLSLTVTLFLSFQLADRLRICEELSILFFFFSCDVILICLFLKDVIIITFQKMIDI